MDSVVVWPGGLAVFVSLENYATLLIDFLVVLQLILANNPRSPPAHHFPHQVFCNLIIDLFKIGLCSFLEDVRFHVQTTLNNNAKVLLKVFNVGAQHGEKNVSRVKSAFTTSAEAPAALWVMPKDHKVIQAGKPMASRAVVSITNTIVARASKLVTNTVKYMADLKRGTCEVKSSENMKAAIDDVNKTYRERAKKEAIPGLYNDDDDEEAPTILHDSEQDAVGPIVAEKINNIDPNIAEVGDVVIKRETDYDGPPVLYSEDSEDLAAKFIIPTIILTPPHSEDSTVGPIIQELLGHNSSTGYGKDIATEAAPIEAQPKKSRKMNFAQKYINEKGKKVVISKDVEKLYPSITTERAGELVYNEVQITSMSFNNINYKWALRYISKSAKSQKEVEDWGFAQWCPVRTKKQGVRPGMTGDSDSDDKWTEGVIPDNEVDKRKILGKVLEIYVKLIFQSNVYTVKGEVKVQTDGAPIGLDLSGEIGRLETAESDIAIAKLCEANHILLDVDGRYVDDDNNVLSAIPYGYRWSEGRVQFNVDWVAEDSKLPEDKHTANVLVDLANSIRPAIQYTADVGSTYTNGRVPILDMAMKVIEATFTEDGITFTCPQVSYNFFKKGMARKTIMKSSSAMPERIKRETLVNELLRRLLNTTQNLPDARKESVEVTNQYMITMKISGYNQKIRRETVISAFKGLKEKLHQSNEDGKRLHRHKEEGARERHMSKIRLKSNWFNKKKKGSIPSQPTPSVDQNMQQTNQVPGPSFSLSQQRRRGKRSQKPLPNPPLKKQDNRRVESVIFIPHTANSSLRKKLQESDDEMTRVLGMGRAKFIEEAGMKLSSMLVVKDPWFQLNGGCGRRTCYPCISSKGKGLSCRSESICYQIVCKLCQKNDEKKTIYIGETSRSGYERILEHMTMFKLKKEGDPEKNQQNSVFWGHSRDSHQGTMKTYDWEIKLVSSHKSALNRQVTEATRISREKKADLFNSKQEFGSNNLAEIELKYGNKWVNSQGGSRKRKRRDEDEDEGSTNPLEPDTLI